MNTQINVALGGRSYLVHVGAGLIEQAGTLAGDLLRKPTVPVVADARAWKHLGAGLTDALAAIGKEIALYEVAPGEDSKSWQSLETLTDWMLAQGVERGDHVIALGGGVVGDLTGFACAVLKPGCGFIQIPRNIFKKRDHNPYRHR